MDCSLHDTSTSTPSDRVLTSNSTVTALPNDSSHSHVPSIEHNYDCVSDAESSRHLDPHCYSSVRIRRTVDVNDDNLTARPQLRKKPKLTSRRSEAEPQSLPGTFDPGMSTLVGVPNISSGPPLHHLSHESPDNITNNLRSSSSTAIAQQPRPSLQRTNSQPQQRSPAHKRPPASHSSYGVETTCGPPPSYSTQRTLSQDRVWTVGRNPELRITNAAPRQLSPTKANESATDPELFLSYQEVAPSRQDNTTPSSTASSRGETNLKGESSPETTETAETPSLLTPDSSTMSKALEPATEAGEGNEHDTADLQGLQPPSADEGSKASSSEDRKSEDLFLNIAKADASRADQLQSRADRRRSRISLPFFNTSRPSTGYKASPDPERFDTASVSGRTEALSYYSKRASLGQHVPGALSRTYTQRHPERSDAFEAQQQTHSSHGGQVSSRPVSRRYSNANTNINPDAGRHLERPGTARNSRLVSDSTFTDRTKLVDHNATESTISTTAPSTVWDELDDLKSRIRKLELTGKLPPSSAAAMNNTDRPKTATTAATTMSSSPKQKTAVTLQSAIEGIPSTVHPNLHEALGNAKAVVSNDVYQKLQATAQDALQLSMMMNLEGYSGAGSTVGVSSVSERQIRRRTESMCRSLTELAIAILADSKSAQQPATRPVSRDLHAGSTLASLRGRRYSNEPAERPPVTSRVQSRLDGRRTSIGVGSPLNPQTGTPESIFHTPPTGLPQLSASSSRARRTSSLIRSRRTPGYLEGNTDDEESSPSVRPVSRAMTEVGAYRHAARDRAAYSREYTAQHPMPLSVEANHATTARSSMPSNLISRRKYASPASSVPTQEPNYPLTPKEPWGRISVVSGAAMSSPIDPATPDGHGQVGVRSASNSRRSLGFASRISSVSSRLRAAKAERNQSTNGVEAVNGVAGVGARGIAPLERQSSNYSSNTTTSILERHNSGPSVAS
ncbi:hypothetical protein ABEF93_005613 [Exophiala dermatitidis]